jgi:phenylacetate-CoA ligase
LQYDFLEKSQWWSSAELENYQNEKLSKLIKHAYENVPYYKKLFEQNKLHLDDIKTAADLAKIPILTKRIIRENFPQQITARNIQKIRFVAASTGGSTGEPLVFYRDTASQDISWAAFFRFFRWIGYDWGDRIALFWRNPLLGKAKMPWYGKILDRVQFSMIPAIDRYDAFRLGDKDISTYIGRLIGTKPQILRGYVNAIVALARYCKSNGIDAIRLKAVTTTAEVLHKVDRKLLQEQFGCGVYDQYGCGECFSISSECDKHSGLHINSEHCVVEILDENNNVLRDGSRGKIIVTDLDNFVMPFIRYSTGDFGSLKTGPCDCGRGLPLMNPVEGRVFGMLRGKDGRAVHGEFFANLLEECGWYKNYNVEAFEVVQEKLGSIIWYLVCGGDPRTEDKDILVLHCKDYFGKIGIELRVVSKIPLLPSGKRRVIRAQAGAEYNIDAVSSTQGRS